MAASNDKPAVEVPRTTAPTNQASPSSRSATMNRNYLVVSAVRNEAEFIGQTLDSLASQTIKPLRWVIVDDGSTDATRTLAQQHAATHAWTEVISRSDRGFRQSGVGVVEAFYEGFSKVSHEPWDYVVKLDGDLRLPKSYFEDLILRFEKDPKLGICSGDIYNDEEGKLILDSPDDPVFHVRGAAKMYRRKCWDAIGGIQRVTGFDTIDNLKARMLGWDTRRIPEIAVIHLRKTGMANGTWKNAFKDGRGANAVGYHPLFLFLKCFVRAFRRGSFVGAVALFCGYVSGHFVDIPKIREPDVIRYLRRQQMNRILGRETIWR